MTHPCVVDRTDSTSLLGERLMSMISILTAKWNMDESTGPYTLCAVDAFCIIYRVWRNGHWDQWTGARGVEMSGWDGILLQFLACSLPYSRVRGLGLSYAMGGVEMLN